MNFWLSDQGTADPGSVFLIMVRACVEDIISVRYHGTSVQASASIKLYTTSTCANKKIAKYFLQ